MKYGMSGFTFFHVKVAGEHSQRLVRGFQSTLSVERNLNSKSNCSHAHRIVVAAATSNPGEEHAS
jgi:hypothetical protein